MSKSKKKEWIELADEKIADLEQRIDELEKHFQQMNKFMSEDMETYASLVWDYVSVGMKRKLNFTDFDYYIKKIITRENELKKIKTNVNCLSSHELTDSIVDLAKESEIPFERLAPYLIEKFGKKLAKKLVRKETMLKNYGKEGFEIWETLLKK